MAAIHLMPGVYRVGLWLADPVQAQAAVGGAYDFVESAFDIEIARTDDTPMEAPAGWWRVRSTWKRLAMPLRDLHDRHLRAWRSTKRRVLEFGVRPWLLQGRVQHLYGPAHDPLRIDELLVITVVRNGALYVKSFMERYLRTRRRPLRVSR